MRLLLEATRTYLRQAELMSEKYPELDTEMPEELEGILAEFEQVMGALQESMAVVADYANDAELMVVMEEFQSLAQ
jgi:hypothetical protein